MRKLFILWSLLFAGAFYAEAAKIERDTIYVDFGYTPSGSSLYSMFNGAIVDERIDPTNTVTHSLASTVAGTIAMTGSSGFNIIGGIQHWVAPSYGINLEFIYISNEERGKDTLLKNSEYAGFLNAVIAPEKKFYCGAGLGFVGTVTDGYYGTEMTLVAQGNNSAQASISKAKTQVLFSDVSSVLLGWQAFAGIKEYRGDASLGLEIRYIRSFSSLPYGPKMEYRKLRPEILGVRLPTDDGIVVDPGNILDGAKAIDATFFSEQSATVTSELWENRILSFFAIELSIGYLLDIF